MLSCMQISGDQSGQNIILLYVCIFLLHSKIYLF